MLKTMSDIEEGTGALSFIEDEYWYYMRKILKSGGNAAELEDYKDSVCWISLTVPTMIRFSNVRTRMGVHGRRRENHNRMERCSLCHRY